MILYLHGFRSSPESFKARLLAEQFADPAVAGPWLCPQLPASPKAAVALAQSMVQSRLPAERIADELVVIGSSLGGYYANWLAEQWGCRAAMLNPAVHAPRDLATQVGTHRNWHDDTPFVFLPEYVDELRAMQTGVTRPKRYLLIAATGDEVLDWREMRDHYRDANQLIVPGGDHSLGDYEPWLSTLLAFAGRPVAQPSRGA